MVSDSVWLVETSAWGGGVWLENLARRFQSFFFAFEAFLFSPVGLRFSSPVGLRFSSPVGLRFGSLQCLGVIPRRAQDSDWKYRVKNRISGLLKCTMKETMCKKSGIADLESFSQLIESCPLSWMEKGAYI